ncbi:hypothetical protein NQ318_022850 [Aromia moschata]|uniref:Saccharopine dehydrogenase NADP binding domain-containing protein n=1 Tax=Aromia moschata TaxID=1265417 RepID=A0AAV8XUX7_9CUCU|nr:hypothetical protein NQ318_022850 [Aromia moschata]
MDDRLDFVLFGATGFTGIHCIPYLHKFSKFQGRTFTWGVAGRSESKLKQVLKKVGKDIGVALDNIPIIIVDVSCEDELLRMARRAKVVLNCCGPFHYLGEPVVKACIAAATHYTDVSAEPYFMEKIQLEYDDAAKKKGVYVVTGSGFDCIPSDMGIVFLQQQFEGTLNSVTTYLKVYMGSGFKLVPIVNYTTWASVICVMGYWNKLKEVRRELFSKKTPIYEPKMKWRTCPHKPSVVDGWAVPFPSADRSIAHRTQRHFYQVDNKRPVQTDIFLVVPHFLLLIGFYIVIGLLRFFCTFDFGRNMFLKYPRIFSAGLVTTEPPSKEIVENTCFEITLDGEGWKTKLPKKDDQYATPCDRRIVGRVSGKDGYATTSVALVLSAIMMITEADKMPSSCGVIPPGAAFAKTSLIKHLMENGLNFEILSRKDLV